MKERGHPKGSSFHLSAHTLLIGIHGYITHMHILSHCHIILSRFHIFYDVIYSFKPLFFLKLTFKNTRSKNSTKKIVERKNNKWEMMMMIQQLHNNGYTHCKHFTMLFVCVVEGEEKIPLRNSYNHNNNSQHTCII